MRQLTKKLLEPKTAFFLAIAYTVFITIGLLAPAQGLLPSQDKIPVDKLFHILLSCILIVVWLLYFYTKENKMMPVTTIYSVFAFCLLYGIIIEALQYIFTIYRQADLLDVVANSIGLFIGLGLFRKYKEKIFN